LKGSKRVQYFSSRYINPEFEGSKSLLFKHNLKYSPKSKGLFLQLNYELANEQSALKEIVYRNVPEGFGQFRRDSINNLYVRDDVAGDLVQFILPTGEFEPVTKIKSTISFRFNPHKYDINFLKKVRINSVMQLNEETRDSYSLSQLLLSSNAFFTDNSR